MVYPLRGKWNGVWTVSAVLRPRYRRLSLLSTQGSNAARQCVVILSYKRMFICGVTAAAAAAVTAAAPTTTTMRAFSGRITNVTRRRFSLCAGNRRSPATATRRRPVRRSHGRRATCDRCRARVSRRRATLTLPRRIRLVD